MQANEAAWYDSFYHSIQTQLGPWYKFALPYLRTVLTRDSRLVELGCGQGLLLRSIVHEKLLPEENIYGMDQSRIAIDVVKGFLPKAHLDTGDIYQLQYPKDFFQVCLLMETIEHLQDPAPALEQIHSVIARTGILLVSFPNFLHLAWLAARLLGDALNKPNWLVRQPIDRIYTIFQVIRIVERAGFKFERGIGSGYGPPILYLYEKEWMTNGLNALGLWWLSFHPILVFRKPL
jgi:2-polyprenyl-3-methyl-5-hydroxy-6-metoxy-1,4-benzoquinol methylase